ncbi:MAG: hypothetical protein P9X24_03040 [Candidatus Hatepunaea meridiana]|nr:hypothetical protein [Candidatus Hatepunaea meridiana]
MNYIANSSLLKLNFTVYSALLLLLISVNSVFGSINVTAWDYGFGFGNSKGINGIRINLSDERLERVNGINLTIWKPRNNPDAIINGAAFGIVGPDAGEAINGIAIGLVKVKGGKLRGVSLSPIGLASDEVWGLGVGGIGLASDRVNGIGISGIGIAADRIRGLGFGTIGLSCNKLRGIGVGGIGIAASDVKGILIGGVGVASGEMTGLAFGLIGVAIEDFYGISIGGIGIAGDNITGICLSGVGIGADQLNGVFLSGLGIKGKGMQGLGISSYNGIKGVQRGVTIGLLNRADELHGCQIGILNIAHNNSGILKVLPFINFHR